MADKLTLEQLDPVLTEDMLDPVGGGVTFADVMAGRASPQDFARSLDPSQISRAEGGVAGALSEGVLTPGQDVISNVAGMPNLILEEFATWLGNKIFGGDAEPTSLFPSAKMVQDFITEKTGLEPNRAETPAGRIGQSAVAGVMATPGAAVLGAVSGAASEVAGQVTEGTRYETIARILAAGAPFAGKLAFDKFRPPPASAIVRELEKLNPEQLSRVQSIMESSQRFGTPVTLAEALVHVTRQPGAAARGQRAVEAIPAEAGTPADRLQGRVAERGETQRSALEGVVPEPARPPTQIASEASRAAADSIQNQRNITNFITRPLYSRIDAAGVALPDDVAARLMKNPQVSDAIKSVRTGPVRGADFAELPDGSTKLMHAAKQDLAGRAAAAERSGDMNAARILGNAARDIDTALADSFAEYAAANRIQARRIASKEAPLKEGPTGAVEATKKLSSQYSAVFKDPLSASARQVHSLVKDLQKFGPPGLAEDFVYQYIISVFNKVGVKDASMQGPRFAAALTKDRAAMTNLESAISALPDGAARAKEIKQLLRVFDAQGRRLPVGSNTAEKLAQEEAMSSSLASVAVETVSSPFRGVPGFMNRWAYGRNAQEMAALLMMTPSELSSVVARSSSDEFIRHFSIQASVGLDNNAN